MFLQAIRLITQPCAVTDAISSILCRQPSLLHSHCHTRGPTVMPMPSPALDNVRAMFLCLSNTNAGSTVTAVACNPDPVPVTNDS